MDREVNWGDVFQDSIEKRQLLEDLLPWKYKYKVSSFQIIEESDIPCEVKFNASLDINVCDQEGLKEFLLNFKEISNTNYNFSNRADNFKGKKFQWTGFRKCIHNVRKRMNKHSEIPTDKRRGMQTDCESFYTFQLSKVYNHEHDDKCEKYSLRFKIFYSHNHSIKSSEATKFSDVNPSTKQKFMQLFRLGGSPSSVYREYKALLRQEHPDAVVMMSAI